MLLWSKTMIILMYSITWVLRFYLNVGNRSSATKELKDDEQASFIRSLNPCRSPLYVIGAQALFHFAQLNFPVVPPFPPSHSSVWRVVMHIEVSAVTDAIPRLAHCEWDKLEWTKTASVIVICLLAVAASSSSAVLSAIFVEPIWSATHSKKHNV